MRKPLFIASSDWHIHKFQAFNQDDSRLRYAVAAGNSILNAAHALGVPHLFCGDLFHSWQSSENGTMNVVMDLFAKAKCMTYAISGNHDMSHKNGIDSTSPSHLNNLYYLRNFKPARMITLPNMIIDGLDYFNDGEELIEAIKILGEQKKTEDKYQKGKPKILMLHTDFPGAKTPTGIEVGEHHFKKVQKLFKPWDLVLMGHIHKPQQLGDKFFMLGSHIHQTSGDIGTKMGYWIFYDDLSHNFLPLSNYPQFVREGTGREQDYKVPNEETLLAVDDIEEQGLFNINNSRKKLAKTYTKIKGIKDKAKRVALIKILNEVE